MITFIGIEKKLKGYIGAPKLPFSNGQGRYGGWDMGMTVWTYRGDYAHIGQFGWAGRSGTSIYADPNNQITGILLTQVGMSIADPAWAIHDFWTMLYQVTGDSHPAQKLFIFLIILLTLIVFLYHIQGSLNSLQILPF